MVLYKCLIYYYYDKVMCAVVASALLCIPGDSCIEVYIASAYFVGIRTNFRERSRAVVYLNHRVYSISYY